MITITFIVAYCIGVEAKQCAKVDATSLRCSEMKTMKNSPATTKITVRPGKAAAAVKSVTREEIERYWTARKEEEEEHLLAALKAAARIRARSLSEGDYKRFEESLMEALKKANEGQDGENNKELRVGIKDWWTKSKYAYLNQPATKSTTGDDGSSKRTTSTCVPLNACSYSPVSSTPAATSLGVF